MDNKEYRENQKKQKKSLKKYRKHIIKAAIFGGIAVASAFLFPAGVFPAIKGLLGESAAINITFFTQWGIAAGGLIGAVKNIFQAHKERKNIENAQDEEEDIGLDSLF